MSKVMIGTPAYDGRLESWYVHSLVSATKLCERENIQLDAIYMSYDALVQRARNDLIALALEEEYDCLIFIDSDMIFDPNWILELINSEKNVIGGTTRKKTDDYEGYSVKTRNLKKENGLIKVDCLGTGFVKISRRALLDIWNASDEYTESGNNPKRMVCDIQIIDGELWSEDRVMSNKLNDCGYDVWLNPNMTCDHIGTKIFKGNFDKFIARLARERQHDRNPHS